MRLSDICRSKPITESIRTDFFDMYLLSSLPYSDDPEVEALLTDRVDRLIEHFREQLYLAFMVRLQFLLDINDDDAYYGLQDIDDPKMMYDIIMDFANSGEMCPRILNIDEYDSDYGSVITSGNWGNAVDVFTKLCKPPKNIKSKIAILDKLFGMVHNGGALTDYLGHKWLFDALYTRALAHPNELARYSSDDARRLATTGDVGYGLGSSLSSYRPVTDADKFNLYSAKQSRLDDDQSLKPRDIDVRWIP